MGTLKEQETEKILEYWRNFIIERIKPLGIDTPFVLTKKEAENLFEGLLKDLLLLSEAPKIERKKITKRVLEAQTFVDEFIETHGYPPTYRQVAEALGLKSSNSAVQHLRYYRHKMVQMPPHRRKRK